MSSDKIFNKNNLDHYFYELSKAYKKLGGKKMPSEIILVGGAAIIENYGFREMTSDIDAVIQAASIMDEAINKVGDMFDLPVGWFNSDFTKTASYSRKLARYSKFYKTFNQVLTIRTVSAEYLIAMKLCSGRKYKNDLSDIVGILAEHQKSGDNITYERIDKAVIDLYDSWENISSESISFIKDTLIHGNYDLLYSTIKEKELETKEMLVKFEDDYPKVLNEDNMDNILNILNSRKSNNNH